MGISDAHSERVGSSKRRRDRANRRKALKTAAEAAVAKKAASVDARLAAAPTVGQIRAEAPAAISIAPSPATVRAGRRRRNLAIWAAMAASVAYFGIAVVLATGVARDDGQPTAAPARSIVVGEPGGAVTSASTVPAQPSHRMTPTPEPTPMVTAELTPMPTPMPPPPPPPATPAQTVPVTPQATEAPTPVIVALAQPDDAVAAFYRHVVAGTFDAAYALWSERMRATYPRQENLDDRFAGTAQITFTELFVAEQDGGGATVQANFVETYDSGASRQFIGFWRLVLVGGRWLLDEPHY
jgi:hypothetical protein